MPDAPQDDQRITVERDAEVDGLVTITLDRPDKLNALDITMHEELQATLTRLETDHAARVVILTGAGRAFSAGAELGGHTVLSMSDFNAWLALQSAVQGADAPKRSVGRATLRRVGVFARPTAAS